MGIEEYQSPRAKHDKRENSRCLQNSKTRLLKLSLNFKIIIKPIELIPTSIIDYSLNQNFDNCRGSTVTRKANNLQGYHYIRLISQYKFQRYSSQRERIFKFNYYWNHYLLKGKINTIYCYKLVIYIIKFWIIE